jgi:hypothetical protein
MLGFLAAWLPGYLDAFLGWMPCMTWLDGWMAGCICGSDLPQNIAVCVSEPRGALMLSSFNTLSPSWLHERCGFAASVHAGQQTLMFKVVVDYADGTSDTFNTDTTWDVSASLPRVVPTPCTLCASEVMGCRGREVPRRVYLCH